MMDPTMLLMANLGSTAQTDLKPSTADKTSPSVGKKEDQTFGKTLEQATKNEPKSSGQSVVKDKLKITNKGQSGVNAAKETAPVEPDRDRKSVV